MTPHDTIHETSCYTVIDSPLGPLQIVEDDRGLSRIDFQENANPDPDWRRVDKLASGAEAQLRAYFRGELRRFDLPLNPRGTRFQLEVWRAVQEIPYGTTRSYAEVARKLGRPRAVRAVGAANGQNPLPIVIPCHRVVGAGGELTGYAGGLERKAKMLELEGARNPLKLPAR